MLLYLFTTDFTTNISRRFNKFALRLGVSL